MVQTMKYMIRPNDRFGDWLVIQPYASRSKRGRAMALCRCMRCGEVERLVLQYDLGRGASKGCGCWKLALLRTGCLRHGHAVGGAKSPTGRAWRDAKRRYGDRMCREWLDSFEEFLKDVGHKPSPNHRLHVQRGMPLLPSTVSWTLKRQTTIPKNVARAKRRVQEAEARKAAQQAAPSSA